MKKLTLLTAVALSCFAVNTSFAQVQILRSGTPTPAPRLISDQTSLAEAEPLPFVSPNAPDAIPNPFDYFDQELPKVEPLAEQSPSVPFADEPAATEDQPNSDPASLPVGRRQRENGPTVVDTIVSQAALGNIANASVTPVYWGGNAQTPNPVAEWLLREECVAGLWANYPQQRAAECAQMWSNLAGHSCGCGAGTCSSGTCGAASASCTTCATHAAPRNRYLERLSAPPMGCNTCPQAAPCATCDSCQPNNGGPAAGCSDCAQQSAQPQPGQPAGMTKLANLPPLGMFR